MEPDLIRISELADFQFCPKSVYFHHVYSKYEKSLYQGREQILGTLHHETVDNKRYSTKKRWLQGMDVYSRKYGLIGKIDLYDTETHTLVERKYHIKRLYLGNLYQIYAQYFALREMGYPVEHLKFHSIRDNKNHPVERPDIFEETKFSAHIDRLKAFEMGGFFEQNPKKCQRCVYRELCDTGIGYS